MLIERGHVRRFSDNVQNVIREYLVGDYAEAQPSQWVNSGKEFENPWFKPIRLYIADGNGTMRQNPVRNDDDIWLEVEGKVAQVHKLLALEYTIHSEEGILIYHCSTVDTGNNPFEEVGVGKVRLRTKIPRRFLNEGVYKIELTVFLHRIQHIIRFGKEAPSIFLVIHGGLSDSPHWIERRAGLLAPMFEWSLETVALD